MPASTSTRVSRKRTRKLSSASVPEPLSLNSASPKPPMKSSSNLRTPVVLITTKKKSTRGKPQQARNMWCICRGPDDRSPMILCDSCNDWFHFTCINLSERDAEDIQLYICDACHTKTGQSTVYEWEGPEAVEECAGDAATNDLNTLPTDDKPDQDSAETGQVGSKEIYVDEPVDEDEEVEEDASGDEYKEEEEPESVSVRRRRGTKIIASSEDEGHEDDAKSPRAASRRVHLKRKRGGESQLLQRKRARRPSSGVGSDNDDDDEQDGKTKRGINKAKAKHDSVLDPTRKYCSGKLREVLVPIFVQYANVLHDKEADQEGSNAEASDEQKKKAEEAGAAYVQDLEECLFETYGEPDKRGNKVAAGKYKDRFRMLTFNLSQPDRHLLRRNIGMHNLPALQLSKMSSVELANEQTKLQIEAANRESLEHSILKQRPIAARAKITHKGEEVIEDLVGDDVGRRIQDEEQRETEREREREKEARERAKFPPPPSPERLSFRGPQDILAQQHSAASQKAAQVQAQRPPLFAASSSLAEIPIEPSFKLDDLIAIDLPDDSPPQEDTPETDIKAGPSPESPPTSNNAEEHASSTTKPVSLSESEDRSASFDLNNVWSGDAPEKSRQDPPGEPSTLPRAGEPSEPSAIDVDLGTAADDEDFDIFLDQLDAPSGTSMPSGPEAERMVFESLPILWSGDIHLPDAGKSPAVQARQVGGRHIDSASSQWGILFPPRLSRQLKVEGRVPVKESAKYMMQNRMNVTRELIIVAFTPSAGRTEFDEIITFLVNRDRHAVVLPWGPNPTSDAPGKELYLIPIMPHETLPEYVEILDLVKFPKQREEKYLLGVFILNKGKFSERVPPAPLQPSLPTPAPSSQGATFAGVAPSAAPLMQTQPPPSAPPEIVSKLTSQQIESLLQTMLSGGLSSVPLPQPQPQQPSSSPATASFPSTFPTNLPNQLPQQFPAVPYPTYPPAGTTPSQHYLSHQSPPYPSHQSPPYNYPSSNTTNGPPRGTSSFSNEYPRTGSGDFGRGRGRGGGRGRGRGDRDFERPLDSGWGGRGRARAHQSPPRPW